MGICAYCNSGTTSGVEHMSRPRDGLILAIATDDGKHLIKRHFGDAESYLIYQLTEKDCVYLKNVENRSEEEQTHADPVKAGNIARILKEDGVQILASRAFGPNIKRMIKKFACILVNEESIAQGLDKMKRNYSDILNKWDNGSERSHLKI